MNTRTVFLHLSLIDGIGPATAEKIIHALLGLISSKSGALLGEATLAKEQADYLSTIYSLTKKDFIRLTSVNESIIDRLVAGLSNKALLEKELELLAKHKISYVTPIDAEYPTLLKNTYLPPLVLYVQGNLGDIDRRIAIVGSRSADDYGLYVVNQLVPELILSNWQLVSGGALGIDTMVHRITVERGGSTVAVLGSGLLRPYPVSNKKLFESIISNNGAVISPFSLLTSALPGNFPARNRIIAGLSKACVVIQAAQKSGALITARFALEQGREVCAVPGPINNPLSAGCHYLISEGATTVTKAHDILLALKDTDTINLMQKQVKLETPVKVKDYHSKARPLDATPAVTPDTVEEKIVKLCSKPISLDELVLKIELTTAELQQILFNLQIEGLLEQDFMGFWVRPS